MNNEALISSAHIELLAQLNGLIRSEVVQPAKLFHAQAVAEGNAVEIFSWSNGVGAGRTGFCR